MARLNIHLLGPLVVQLDGFPVDGLNWSRARALLAYLAVEADRPHPRETLSGMLWPDQPERSARTNLRNALSSLRKAIGDRARSGDRVRSGDRDAVSPCLTVTRETIQFNAASDCWVDVTAFERLASAVDATADQLERAIALYRAPFLEGFSMGDSPDLDDWALAVRERLEHQFSNALQALAANYEQRGAYARACEIARRWVTHVPWQEQAHQELMRLLALRGQRSAALAQFEACCRALREELDVEPSESTVQLYERIRDEQLGPPAQLSASETGRGDILPASILGSAPEEVPVTLPPASRVPFLDAEGGLHRERRIVTVLVAALARRTAWVELIDVEMRVKVMQHTFPLLVDEIERYGGEVERYLDDGLIALFGASTAHEDDPERAVLAALAMGEAVQPYLGELAAHRRIHLSLRVGVSTGEAIAALVGDHQHVWAEAAIDRALALVGEDGEARTSSVWVAEDTHRLVASLFEWAQESARIDGRGPAYRPLQHRGL
jgi:DNA-binding SARP family transcriptional activator/class 3 adenylate cyclase